MGCIPPEIFPINSHLFRILYHLPVVTRLFLEFESFCLSECTHIKVHLQSNSSLSDINISLPKYGSTQVMVFCLCTAIFITGLFMLRFPYAFKTGGVQETGASVSYHN